jgi:hypothetical protein
MRTKLTIGAIALSAVIALAALVVAAWIEFGMWRGLSIAAAVAVMVIAFYRAAIRPWHSKWGATKEELQRAMPGDGLLDAASSTTRAISIAAPAERIWPWLVQIGYGRAGWYSYDWIDNDGRPSADHIVSELQNLEVGDTIPFIPGMGPRVEEIEPPGWIVSAGEEDSWCLALYSVDDDHTRLVSRWRVAWRVTPASLFWILISDPGAFVMEQKMLRGIKKRAETATIKSPLES